MIRVPEPGVRAVLRRFEGKRSACPVAVMRDAFVLPTFTASEPGAKVRRCLGLRRRNFGGMAGVPDKGAEHLFNGRRQTGPDPPNFRRLMFGLQIAVMLVREDHGSLQA